MVVLKLLLPSAKQVSTSMNLHTYDHIVQRPVCTTDLHQNSAATAAVAVVFVVDGLFVCLFVCLLLLLFNAVVVVVVVLVQSHADMSSKCAAETDFACKSRDPGSKTRS